MLACRAKIAEVKHRSMPWPAYHWAGSNAITLYAQYSALLTAYPVMMDDKSGLVVKVHGSTRQCLGAQVID